MVKNKWWLIFSIVWLIGVNGCAYESLTYRMVHDGVDKREYLVVGRVMDAGEHPIENCSVFLSKGKKGADPVFAGVTDHTGNYHLKFELEGATDFWLHFDAREQGYNIRYESITHSLESRLFQSSGNTPVVVNVIMDKTI